MKNSQTSVNKPALGPGLRAVLIFILAFLIFPTVVSSHHAGADTEPAGTQLNVTVDYLEEIAVVTTGPAGSNKFYISTDNMKTWENIDGSGIVDLSSFLSTKKVTLYFKGNKDQKPVKIELPAEDKNLKVKYELVAGEGRIVISDATGPVEYRKGNNGTWKAVTGNILTSVYELKGATLYFRTAATQTRRAGKLVSVKIPKRPAAPAVSLDASKLTIKGLKANQTQYRVGDALSWTTFVPIDPKTTTIDLSALLMTNSTANNLIPAGTIEFRTIGSNKKAHSAIKVIELQAQAPAPTNVALSGTTLTISDINVKKEYEYATVPQNTTINIKNLKWTTVTAKNSVIIPKVNVGDKVLVRVKSTTNPDTKVVILPSAYTELLVTSITPAKK